MSAHREYRHRSGKDIIVGLIEKNFTLGSANVELLNEAIEALYNKFNVTDTHRPEEWPLFLDVIDYLINREYKDAQERSWLRPTLRALRGLTTGILRTVCNTYRKTNFAHALKHSFAIEAAGAAKRPKSMLFSSLFNYIYYYRQYQHQNAAGHPINVVAEEYHNLAFMGSAKDEDINETMFRQCREIKIRLTILDQLPAALPASVLGNTNTVMCMRLKHSDDINEMGRQLLLDTHERGHLGRLPDRRAVVKVRHHKPFEIEIPFKDITEVKVSDKQLKKHMAERNSATILGLDNVPVPVHLDPVELTNSETDFCLMLLIIRLARFQSDISAYNGG